MSGFEAQQFQQATGNTAQFQLFYGGIYQVSAQGFSGGSVTLTQLGPDQANYLTVTDAFTADGGDTIYLPPGRYRFAVTNQTSPPINLYIVRVPTE